MNEITARVAKLTTDTLREMAVKLSTDYRREADIVLDACIAELARRLPEPEFVALCDSL